MLRADVFVIEALRLLVGELHHFSGSVGKPFVHFGHSISSKEKRRSTSCRRRCCHSDLNKTTSSNDQMSCRFEVYVQESISCVRPILPINWHQAFAIFAGTIWIYVVHPLPAVICMRILGLNRRRGKLDIALRSFSGMMR
jgi:hypothetical protein